MFKIKCCGTCLYCRLDLKALNCGVIVDMCGPTGETILRPWLSGFRCKMWRAENGRN